MSDFLFISDAAKEVNVESHVLRYWEEELHLPIKRNELGHRYYTEEDVERFKRIKSMKERGLQLKAIKMILKDGRLDIIPEEGNPHLAIDIVDKKKDGADLDRPDLGGEKRKILPTAVEKESDTAVALVREEKARKLQWLLQQMMRETLKENNIELSREIKESILKEMDYQFRCLEEHEEERDRVFAERSERYYQRMDELLRKKAGRIQKAREDKTASPVSMDNTEKENKKKRHFIF